VAPRTLLAGLLAVLAIAACSCARDRWGLSYDGGPGSADDSGSSSGGSSEADTGPVDAPTDYASFGDGSSLPPPNQCKYRDGTDHDGDGFAYTQGDCNDCDPNSNPGAFDVPNDGVDEDCDGIVDDEPTGCDKDAVLDSPDPFNAVLAMDVCRKTTEAAQGPQRTWGVVSASFVAPDESDQCVDKVTMQSGSCAANASFHLGHGNLTKLGVNAPKQGTHMFVISSGTARDPTDPGYQDVKGFDKGFTVGAASGFPIVAPACPAVVTGQPHDGVALRIVIRVPTNASSVSFEENFFSYEFPTYVCSTYNDSFVVELTPQLAGLSNANVAFDQFGNPICVNNSLLQVCDPQTAGVKTFPCPLGSSLLQGTGFGKDTAGANHAATGWLETTINVDPTLRGKDVTLLFAIWDSEDGIFDSTAIIDNLTWSTMPGQPTPVTTPAQ
jgi:hypothetical protein